MPDTVFLDIETTGLDPQVHEILEVAIVGDRSAYFSLPIDLTVADEKALEVNRYTERRGELAPVQVWPLRAAYLLTDALQGAVVVGNNPQFDLRFIEAFLRRCIDDLDPTPWQYHPVDLKALVAGRYRLGPAPWSTGQIAEAVGVPLPDDAHSALADACWNQAVYHAVVGGTYSGRVSCA